MTSELPRSFTIGVEHDPERHHQFAVAIRDQDGYLIDLVAQNLNKGAANRCLLPSRRAFLAGMAWVREEVVSNAHSLMPPVTCVIGTKDAP